MKVTFYKSILSEDLTPTDKIVFCQVLYLSLMEKGGVAFDSRGCFKDDSIHEDYGGYIPLSWRVSERYLSKVLIISLAQSYLSLNRLREKGYIIANEFNEEMVKFINLIPFYELEVESGLCGMELIVYSYLISKSKKYEWIDKYHKALAEDLLLSPKSLERIIDKLNKKGFLQRMRKGHQVLLRPCLKISRP